MNKFDDASIAFSTQSTWADRQHARGKNSAYSQSVNITVIISTGRES